jgi:subtilisin-like proprotein convertase family protein
MDSVCSANRRIWRYLTEPLLFLLIGWMASETPAGPSIGGTHAKAIPSRHVNVDILPGESDNLIDTSIPGWVKVALLGAPNFDLGTLDPESLRFGSVAASKRDDGSLVWFEDTDGDGRQDLLFQIWGPSLQLGMEPAHVHLTGRTLDGTRIVGTDRVEPMDSLRLRSLLAAHRDESLGKLPPIRVRLQAIPAGPGERQGSPGEEVLRVAVLSDPGFDAGTVDPASVSLSGFPVTKGRKGGWSEFQDVDGDGRRDLLLAVSRTLLSRGGEWPQAVLRGMTFNGRFIEGAVLLPNASTRTVTFHSPVRPSGSPIPEIFNHAGITINDSAPATPYPSVIDVGTGGLVAKVRVTLYGFTHTYPQDLDIVLVGPGNSSVVLMSDVGGVNPGVANVTLTFDDDASQFVPEASNLASGIYKPTNSGAGDSFPAPAPSTVTATGLSIFNTIFATGYWQLFIVDDTGADVGSITGWSLEFELFDYQCAGSPAVTLSDNSTASPYPILISAGSGAPAGKVTVMLEGLTHPAPDDLDLLLVSPEGRKVVLMSDAGGAGAGPSPVTITFDQDAPGVIPDSTLPEGVYRPFNYDDGIPDAFPAPAPPGPYDTSLSAFVGDAINGSWQLYIVDDAAPGSGSIQDICLGVTIVDPAADSNRSVMTIPQGAPGVTQGPAAPYPSSIPIYGVSGRVANVTVELYGFNHTYPDDLDLMLVGPQGQNVILMSDAGGNTPVPAPGLFLRFDNGSPLVIPDSTGLGNTTYRPANYAGGDGDLFPAPAPLPSGATALTTFNGTDPNGIWSLYVLDDEGGDVGSLLDGWALFLTTVLNPTTFCNDGAITIPAGAPVFTGGPAAPYPSTINVSGLSSPAGRVKVKLNSLHHTYPDDLDVLLVGPQGQNLILMSDAGGDLAASGVTLTLDDEALTPVPDESPGFGTGSFHPINHGGASDPFPAPAPAASAATGLSVFAGTDPNGTWSLYVTDDNDVDVGGIDRGWCLEVSPLYPASGTTTIQWGSSDGTSLEWGDFGLNAIGFNLYRGNSSDLPKLQDASVDSCLRGSASGFSFQGLSEVPPPGGLYWYLLRSFNSGGQESSPGLIRYNSSYVERVQNSSGACP